jgi:hypothetical protein
VSNAHRGLLGPANHPLNNRVLTVGIEKRGHIFRVLNLHTALRVLQHTLRGQEILPRRANGGQNLMSNPSLKGFGFRLAAAEDEAVQTSLVDAPLFQVASPATNRANTVFVVELLVGSPSADAL